MFPRDADKGGFWGWERDIFEYLAVQATRQELHANFITFDFEERGAGSFHVGKTSGKRSDVLGSSLSLLFLGFFSGKGRLLRSLRPAPSIGMVVEICCGNGA